MRWLLVLTFSLLAFAPVFVRSRSRGALGMMVVVPPFLFSLLCILAYFIEVKWVHSLHHSSHALWLVWWFVMGFGLCFPVFYLGWWWHQHYVRRVRSRALQIVTGLNLLVGVVIFYSLFIEPLTLAERHYVLMSSRAPKTPLKILHVSDLQTDGECHREDLVRAAAMAGKADLVFFTGDISNDVGTKSERADRIQSAQLFFESIQGKYGAFGVPGDWDGWVEEWPQLLKLYLKNSELVWLDNQLVEIEALGIRIVVYGIGGAPGIGGEASLPDMSKIEGLRIVIAHHPDDAVELVKEDGADLILVGHTHGGQIVLPFIGALTTHTELGVAGGRVDHQGIPMFISRGIGMRGAGAPRMRLGCQPEISWITVQQ